MTARRRSRWLRTVGGLALAAALVPGSATALAAAQDLQLAPPSVADDGSATVLATVPAVLSDQDLTSAFTAAQAGRPVTLTAARLISGPVDLVVALDTSGSAADLLAEQSATADLLRSLPPQTPTTVLPGGVPTTATAALAAVGALTPGSAGLLDGLPAAGARRRVVVAITGCPALDRESRDADGAAQVSVLAIGPGCGASAARLAGRQAGVVRTGLDAARLVAATDEVTRSLLGEYALRVPGPVGAGPLDVTVSSSGTTATASVALPTHAPAPVLATGHGSGSGGDRPAWPVVLATALAAVAAAGLALELLARRRSPLDA